MPKQLIAINSNSTGRFTDEVINGRSHIVTSMISIEGNSVMNRIFYPFDKVVEAHNQLDNLIAPAGHPEIDGQNVSAFHPTAINSFHVGAFVRKPTMEGQKVVNELVIDRQAAEATENGREIIRRIENGDKIGVSTGLKARLLNREGEHGGRKFDAVIDNIEFDHVAILLDEKPAGENTFTINSGEDNEETVIVCQVNEEIGGGSSGDKIHQEKGFKMNKEIFVLALIANAATGYNPEDKDFLMEKDEYDLANEICKATDFDEAKGIVEGEGFKVNKIDEETEQGFSEYVANKEAFEGWKAAESKRLEEMADHIAANSDFEKDDLLNMGESEMLKINKLLDPAQSYEVNAADTVIEKSDSIKLHEGA